MKIRRKKIQILLCALRQRCCHIPGAISEASFPFGGKSGQPLFRRSPPASTIFPPQLSKGQTVGHDIKLTASDHFQLGGYRADPSAAPKAAVVVIQEIFGVNHHIRAVCDRLAREGYVAIAPAIFDRIEHNFQSGYSPDEIAVARKFVADPDWAAMLRDTQAAIDAVRDVGPAGIIGFCLGGSIAYAAATKLSGLKAAIGYYGGGGVCFSADKTNGPGH